MSFIPGEESAAPTRADSPAGRDTVTAPESQAGICFGNMSLAPCAWLANSHRAEQCLLEIPRGGSHFRQPIADVSTWEGNSS